MIKEGKFGVHEATCLVTIAMTNKIFFSSPGFLTRSAGTSGWYLTIISTLVAVLGFVLTYLLLKRFPGKNVVQIYDIALGRLLGFIFSSTLMASFLVYAGMNTREFIDVIKVYSFPYTPPSFLIGSMLLIVAISAYLGIETIARVAKLAAYMALFAYLVLIVLSAGYSKFAHLFPILGYGMGKTVTTALSRTSAFGEVIILAVFAGSLQGASHIKKAGFISLILSGVLLSFAQLCFILVFSYTSTVEITAPLYVLVRLINYGSFFQRLDPLFLFLWVITTIVYISTLFYTTLSIYCKMFRLQDARPLIIPMAVIVFILALYPKDYSGVVTTYVPQLRTYGNFTFFIFPVIALIAAMIRKKKGKGKLANA